jgi:hypothetical protein
LTPGDTVIVSKFYDNWAYATKANVGSGWVLVGVINRSADTLPRCYNTTFGYNVCAPDWISEAITVEARKYGVSRDLLMQMAACESDYKPPTIGDAGSSDVFLKFPNNV